MSAIQNGRCITHRGEVIRSLWGNGRGSELDDTVEHGTVVVNGSVLKLLHGERQDVAGKGMKAIEFNIPGIDTQGLIVFSSSTEAPSSVMLHLCAVAASSESQPDIVQALLKALCADMEVGDRDRLYVVDASEELKVLIDSCPQLKSSDWNTWLLVT